MTTRNLVPPAPDAAHRRAAASASAPPIPERTKCLRSMRLLAVHEFGRGKRERRPFLRVRGALERAARLRGQQRRDQRLDACARYRDALAHALELAVVDPRVDRLGGDEQPRAGADETPRQL